ncbi:MAG: DNA mismatch repair endonuclease MutL [Anaerovoracaceae bacterium]
MKLKIARIEELPSITAGKIAAGEVIERPVSIIKELMENSIDAGASSITVEIKSGGKSYIRVTDNGSGIMKDDAELAFKRHATSKLHTIKDLDTLSTLGFRGEALSSIAAVSRTELITCTSDAEIGTNIHVEGGAITENSDIGCQQGTTVIVRDLFYNTPARLKFMKKDNTESSLIIDFVSKMALAYPHVRIRLINNDNTLFSTPGRGERFSAIATVYDPQMAEKLIKIENRTNDGMTIEGYISAPDATRASRINQIFFVNGRYVQNKIIENAVRDAYREKVFEGRFPIAFLFLEVNPETLDVNIHPNKKNIKFDNEASVKSFIEQSVRKGLSTPDAVPEIYFSKDSILTEPEISDKQPPLIKTNQEKLDIQKILSEERASENRKKALIQNRKPENNNDNYKINENAVQYEVGKNQSYDKAFTAEASAALGPKPVPPANAPFDVASIKPVGVIFSTYILGVDHSTFYIIDQHAAHERVFYEQFCREFYNADKLSQILALPFKVDVTHSVANNQNEWLTFLKNAGFSIEEFGSQSYIVREIPMYMEMAEAEAFINDFFDNIEDPATFKDQKHIDKLTIKACKSAVKGNDALTMQEIDKLLLDLATAVNPFSCPHGRPTVIKMKRTEIEALFKR